MVSVEDDTEDGATAPDGSVRVEMGSEKAKSGEAGLEKGGIAAAAPTFKNWSMLVSVSSPTRQLVRNAGAVASAKALESEAEGAVFALPIISFELWVHFSNSGWKKRWSFDEEEIKSPIWLVLCWLVGLTSKSSGGLCGKKLRGRSDNKEADNFRRV